MPGNSEHFWGDVNADDAQAEPGQTHGHVARATTEIEYVGTTHNFCHAAVDPVDMAQR